MCVCVCVCVCVLFIRSVQLGHPTSLTRNLVGPKHSLANVRASEMPKQIFTFAFNEAPFLQANRGDHVDDQIEQIMCFSCFVSCV